MVKNQKFIIDEQVVEVNVGLGDTLLDVAIRAKLPLNHSCGGMGTCGTCRVIVCEGLETLELPGTMELEIIRDRGFLPVERLACQNEPAEGLIVKIPMGLKDV